MNTNYQILNSTHIGSVLYCQDCHELMIGIGTVLIKFSPNSTITFLQTLQRTKARMDDQSETKQAFLRTPIENLLITLNRCELEQAIDLIHFALLRLEVETLLLA